eukprot:TRINITY_DN35904_c0_g1_i1.p1 TRINITY_DN35904_c0_g1~~TRINITY_DN35904_c0_g1_i1.p1  ORF type:complete len:402 (+),score=97.52 TRINITY_DN35904_c0_g1_i1:166-1371(+)
MAEGSNPPTFEPINEEETSEQQKKTSQLFDTVKRLMEQGKGLQETATKYSGRLKTEGDALGEQAIALEKEIKSVLKQVNVAVEREEISSESADKLEGELMQARGMVYEGDLAALLPHKANGWFLGLFLGHVNVKSARKDVRFKVKEEYNSYRDCTAQLFLAFPVILMLLRKFWWTTCLPGPLVQTYEAWLLFFYASLAMRENVLRINGSDIRPWWIQHHYYAMLMSLVSLTRGIEGADCAKKQHGIFLFLTWAIMQGVTMLLQNRYQRQRLYTRIALGKAGRMDVVWGETAGMKGQLLLLYPLLFVLQGFQFYIAVQLLLAAYYEETEWQMAACGLLLLIMASGNFRNTVATVVAKFRIKAKMRKQGRVMLKKMASTSSRKVTELQGGVGATEDDNKEKSS